MAKGVSISVASDTKDFLKGIKTGVIEPLDDASDKLKDLAKDGDRAGEKLEDSMRDAQKDTERLAKEYDELGDKIRESSRRGGQGLKDNTADATRSAARDLGELKDEAVQNASETFSSFDGSVDSLVDGVQGTFGGIVSSLGPVGAAAGAAAAVGIGLLTAELQSSAEEANRVREETSELAKEIIDAGGSIEGVAVVDKVREWSLEISDNKEWWEIWQKASTTNLERVRELAGKTGTDFKTMFNAMSGLDNESSLDLLEDLEGRLSDVRQQYNNLSSARAGGTERAGELKDERDALESVTEAIREKLNIQDGAIEDARLINELTAEYAAQEEAAAAATAARADAMGALQGELDEAVGAWGEYIDAESGAIDPGAYIEAMQARMDATSNFNSNVQSIAREFNLSSEEVQAILDQGVDFAPMLQSIIDSGMAPEFIAQIQAAVGGGQEILDGTPLGATVTADADVNKAQSDLEGTAKDRDTTVNASADTRRASNQLDRVAERKRTATIDARANTSAAQRALATAARARTAPITAEANTWMAGYQIDLLTRPRTVQIMADIYERRGRRIL